MKKFKKFLVILGALAGAIITAIFAIEKIKQCVKGKVKAPSSFLPVPGDPGKIYVKNDRTGKFETAKLPEKVKFKDVKAATITEGGGVVVEIKHETVDRRSGDPIPDSAYDRLKHGNKEG